ncbi:SCP2 sterol-binding domain-containing protein [Virgibacillus siamensis]|uniref:SCP2 sterol-binding domain-containing protein n=1 Tax=Virgibacillus siamensis TaxID=480071 RepID=UPI000986843E|nr:SCP2 sterol-binding domain-containing protein [Virgibacillus siamensis]
MSNLKDTFREIDQAIVADPSRAKGLEAVYQFNLNGDESGTYQIVFNGDQCHALEGEQNDPDCTLNMQTEDFLQMVKGELNGTKAFMSGRLKIKGNMGLALKLQDILSTYNKAAK